MTLYALKQTFFRDVLEELDWNLKSEGNFSASLFVKSPRSKALGRPEHGTRAGAGPG